MWFDSQAEEAANFYVSVFSARGGKDSKIKKIARYPKAAEKVSGKSAGSVMTVAFELNGQEYLALNGGPTFKFSEAVSFIVNCEDQEEVDYYWDKLTEGGDEKAQICGWLKDKYGLSWQIVPTLLGKLLGDKDAVKAQRVMQAMLKMQKIDTRILQQAYEQS